MLRFVGDVEPYELGKMITIHDLGFEDSELFAIRLPGIFVVVSHGCTSSVILRVVYGTRITQRLEGGGRGLATDWFVCESLTWGVCFTDENSLLCTLVPFIRRHE